MKNQLVDTRTKTSSTTLTVVMSAVVTVALVSVGVGGGLMAIVASQAIRQPDIQPQKKFLCASVASIPFGEKPDRSKTQLTAGLADRTTNEVYKKNQLRKKSSRGEKNLLQNELMEKIIERKEWFREAMERSPKAALLLAFPESERNDLRELTENCIEQPAAFEGSLEVLHADFFEDKIADTRYYLTSHEGQRIQLHPASALRFPVESRTKVKVKGLLLDNHLVFDASQTFQAADFRGGIDLVSQPGNPPVFGEQKVAFILLNFQNTHQMEYPTKDILRRFIVEELAPYYAENSFNQISVSGDTYGWYQLTVNEDCATPFVEAAIAAADGDIFYPNYSRLVFIIPAQVCTIGGNSIVGKKTFSTNDGPADMSYAVVGAIYASHLYTVGHELGHSFGNGGHANAFHNCREKIDWNHCDYEGYGDRYDIMGAYGSKYHFNAVHKEYLGWFNPENITAVAASGRFTLAPMETPAAALQAVKIPRGEHDFLFVEYRQPIGFDAIWPGRENIYGGALLHTLVFADDPSTSALLDAAPEDNFILTVPVDSSFTDPNSGTRVSVMAADQSGITLDVALGKTDFSPPEVAITSPPSGTTVAGSQRITAVANDASGIEKVEFWLEDYPSNILLDTDETAPYEATLDTTRIVNNWHYLYAVAYDRSGQPYGVEGNAARSPLSRIIVENMDPIPPTVAITTPTDGAVLSNPVTITVEASDNIGIWHIELSNSRDNWPFHLFRMRDPLPWSITGGLTAGEHQITATAYDLARNRTASPPVAFTVTDDFPISLSIASPADGAYVRGETVVRASLALPLDDEVIDMSFYANERFFGFASRNGPYEAVFYSQSYRDGNYALQVRGLTRQGIELNSAPVTITVDNTPPSVELIRPQDRATVSGLVPITVSTFGNVERVDFYIDDNILVGTDTTSPYEVNWDSTQATNGDHAVYAKAVDVAGNSSFTAKHRVTVDNMLFLRGDANNDGRVDISDPIRMLEYLFIGGEDILCRDAADANDSGTLDISDPIFTLNFLFLGTPSTIPPPYPNRGADQTADGLGCNR